MDSVPTTSIGLVIPVLNAGPYLDRLLPALQRQTVHPDRFVVMDSQSDDDSAQRLRAAGAEIVTVRRNDFDHGATRQQAAELLGDCDLLIYLTQDAAPANDDSFAELLAAFDDPAVGVAYGRQLPRADATPISAHARLFNYPPRSASVSFAERRRHGFKAFFSSNSFAAYRHDALRSIGGFPHGTLFGEDALTAARLLEHGWQKRYCADAQVIHSHNYTIFADFRRAFDIGVFHASQPWLSETFGGATGEGRRFVASEIRYLAARAPLSIVSALARTVLKAAAYYLGRRYRMLPVGLSRQLSFNRRYWSSAMPEPGGDGN